jgi:ubiquinone/menaquinone biosynthesis C-methylase UbiE/alkylhydroperoxidase/carboxymuconolactone decarboxylase family protein YurZ
MRESWTAPMITGLSQAYWQACALQAAVQNGLTARLAQGPASLDDLCQELVLSRRGLKALLTSLLTLGLLAKQGDIYSLHAQAAPFLTPGSPDDQSNAILHMADMVADWAQLDWCVRTGQPVERERVTGSVETPEREHFYRAMRDIARQQAPGLAGRLGLKAGQKLLDLGGGPGVYAHTFSAEVSGLKAAVFDLPGAKIHFEKEAGAHPGAGQVDFIEGDYHKDDLGSGYDVMWISQVLHGEGPEECERLVQKAARALAPGGVLFVQEFVVDPEGQGHPFAALFSLNMLVNTKAGCSYSADELADFMALAGLEEIEHLGPTREKSPAALMRGVKAP